MRSEHEEKVLVKDAECAIGLIDAFIGNVAESANMESISTGFGGLDDYLGGGLFEGLYCICAVSSLGKTTFVLQMADSIAANGTDVMIFSLEMSKYELMAKSISRSTCLLSMTDGKIDECMAKTVRGITQGSRYKNYSKAELNTITKAIDDYKKSAKNVYICVGVGDISVEHIRQITDKHIQTTGRRPVIIVDYLQILASVRGSERSTDKQNMDKSIVELKRLSRDKKVPVIAISSMSRHSIKNEGKEEFNWDNEMTGFKESGAIEYSADVLMKLKATNDKSEHVRDVSLLILKNRNGAITDKPKFKFYTKYSYFDETVTIRY